MSSSHHIYLANDVCEMWEEIGSPSLSKLLKEKITEEKAKADSKRIAASAPVHVTTEDMEAAFRAEQEEEKNLAELQAQEKYYLENKEALLQQAREEFEKNKGQRGFGAMEVARRLTKWRAGQKEIAGELLKGEIDAKGKM